MTVGTNTATSAILSGTGAVNGSLTTATTGSNIAYLAPGVNTTGSRTDFGNAGTLTVGGALNIGSGTNMDIDLATATTAGGGVNDLIAMSGGTLTFGGSTTVNFNALSSVTLGTAYTLINGAGSISGFNGSNFMTSGVPSGDVATFTDSANAVYVTFNTAVVTSAYFNGLGNNLNVAGNYDTTASSGTANAAAPSSVTDVYFAANRNGSTTPDLTTGALAVNSVTFGAGTGTNKNITVSSTSGGALTISASAGNGITILTGGGSDTISAPVVLAANQTWTPTDSTSTLTVSGQVSGGYKLTTAGAGTTVLTHANTYTGGTAVTAGTLYANGGGTATSITGSATGKGAITVNGGAALGGSGVIQPGAGKGITLMANSTLISGGIQTGSTTVSAPQGSGLTLDNTSAGGNGTTILDASVGSADLTFYLGAGSTTGAGFHSWNTPNLNSTYLTVLGNTAGELKFATGDTITVNDVSGNTLQLNMATPYLLIQTSATDNSDFTGLTTTGGVSVGGVAQNGYVTNLSLNGTAVNETWYPNLYLNNGDLEMVPEPSTWAMMIGGLALLVFIQRRRKMV